MVTRYGFDDSGSRDFLFCTPVPTGPGAHQASCTVSTGATYFPGGKAPRLRKKIMPLLLLCTCVVCCGDIFNLKLILV